MSFSFLTSSSMKVVPIPVPLSPIIVEASRKESRPLPPRLPLFVQSHVVYFLHIMILYFGEFGYNLLTLTLANCTGSSNGFASILHTKSHCLTSLFMYAGDGGDVH